MFEAIPPSFYSEHQDFLNGVATTLTLLGTGIGVVSYLKARQRRVYYHWDRVDLTPENIPPEASPLP